MKSMHDEEAFLGNIRANPTDTNAWLVFADWLEERGDPRAELIRVRQELARADVPDRETANAHLQEFTRHRELGEMFGFAFPTEFFLFWEFAREIEPEDPSHVFRDVLDFSLAGPFDVLAGRFDRQSANYDPVLHWRYFGDPPEFVTIVIGHGDGLHWGYVVEREAEGPKGIAGYFSRDTDVSLFEEPPGLFGFFRKVLHERIPDIQDYIRLAPNAEDQEEEREKLARCEHYIAQIDAFCQSRHLVDSVGTNLDVVDDCNDEWGAFSWRDLLPWRKRRLADPRDPSSFQDVDLAMEELDRVCEASPDPQRTRLHIGRFLWHWHTDGDKNIEECAFSLLDRAYTDGDNPSLRRILKLHRDHRHRRSLDVFDEDARSG